MSVPTDDRAAVPTISVALLVAIGVVLSAVVASTFLSIASEPSEGVMASVTISADPADDGTGSVTVQLLDTGNADRVEVNYTVETNPGSNSVSVTSGSQTLTKAGDTVTLEEDGGNADETIEVSIVVVGFRDGESAVLMDRTEEL